MSYLFPDDMNLFLRAFLQYAFLLVRYALFAGGAYLFFYVIRRRKWLVAKIQQKYPENKQIKTEIKYSLLSFAVFCAMSIFFRILSQQGILELKIYRDFSQHSWLYFIGTTAFIIFFHDTYFYWIHRLMHHPLLYERVHKVHHLSKDPTPFAAFAFHPIEALLELGFVPILAFTLPLHFSSILILAMWQIGFNVMGHSGHEAFPRKNKFMLWFNTSTNHNMHHKYVRCNYGLYFNIWDRLMKTNHPKYFETFDAVTARRDEAFAKMKDEENELQELTLNTSTI